MKTFMQPIGQLVTFDVNNLTPCQLNVLYALLNDTLANEGEDYNVETNSAILNVVAHMISEHEKVPAIPLWYRAGN